MARTLKHDDSLDHKLPDNAPNPAKRQPTKSEGRYAYRVAGGRGPCATSDCGAALPALPRRSREPMSLLGDQERDK